MSWLYVCQVDHHKQNTKNIIFPSNSTFIIYQLLTKSEEMREQIYTSVLEEVFASPVPVQKKKSV